MLDTAAVGAPASRADLQRPNTYSKPQGHAGMYVRYAYSVYPGCPVAG